MCAPLTVSLDRSHSEHRLSIIHGHHRRRTHVAPGPRHRPRWLLARHARQLDHLPAGPGICPEIPARTNLGSIFQHRGLLHWHLYQHPYQEEEACCFEEEGEFSPRAERWSSWLIRTFLALRRWAK